MTIDVAPAPDTAPATAASASASRAPRWGWAVGALLGLGTSAAVAAGLAGSTGADPSTRGLLAAMGAAMAAGCAWRLAGARPSLAGATGQPAAAPATVTVDPNDNRRGAAVMVREVVPMWHRQLETARHTAESGLGNLLATFSAISDQLGTVSQQTAGEPLQAAPGAVDGAIAAQHPALAALQAPSERAFAQRDEAVAALAGCADSLGQLQLQAKHAREIARHTRLVAFNASIESQRDRGEGGSQAIATEIRSLAQRMAETGEQIERLAGGLLDQVNAVRQRGAVNDTSPDELRMEIALRAREALTALLGGTAGLGAGGGLTAVVQSLRDRIDDTFVDFQYGDRLSQMLSIIGNDMDRFARWVAQHPQATATDAAEWLAALQVSYTMDEQRSSHHGNVHVDRGSEIEFF